MSKLKPASFDCWKHGNLYSEAQVDALESRITQLESVAKAVKRNFGILQPQSAYNEIYDAMAEAGYALRAAGYEV